MLRYVDHHSRTDQSFERDLVDRPAPFGEVDRRVEMGAAMLRGRDAVGGVEEAGLGHAVGEHLELELRRRGRPVQRVGVVSMTQVDEPIVAEVQRVRGPGADRDDRGDDDARDHGAPRVVPRPPAGRSGLRTRCSA